MTGGFTREERDRVNRLCDDLPAGVPLAVVLTGSQAAGLGNVHSDLDVLVLAAEPVELPAWVAAAADLDVTVVEPPRIAQYAAELAAAAADPTDRHALSADEPSRWKPVVRLVLGEPVRVTGPGRALLDRLDRTLLRRVLLALFSVRAGNLTEDAVGALRSEDLLTALCASEEAVRNAAEAALVVLDDLYFAPKFLFRRLARQPGLAWVLDHREAFGLPAADPADGRRLVRRRLWLAGHLNARAVLNGAEDVAEGLPRCVLHGAGPVRSPYFSLVRYRGGIGVTGPRSGYALSEPAAALWALLDGRPAGEVLGELDSLGHRTGPLAGEVERWLELGVAERRADIRVGGEHR
ncbi:nucleotidyltransferase domain-containing protein [Amycolatopsis sp. NPDC004772]